MKVHVAFFPPPVQIETCPGAQTSFSQFVFKISMFPICVVLFDMSQLSWSCFIIINYFLKTIKWIVLCQSHVHVCHYNVLKTADIFQSSHVSIWRSICGQWLMSPKNSFLNLRTSFFMRKYYMWTSALGTIFFLSGAFYFLLSFYYCVVQRQNDSPRNHYHQKPYTWQNARCK